MISSLKEETLYRVKLNGISPIVIEPIYIGSRIRDIVNYDGGFALQTDEENQLILVKRTMNAWPAKASWPAALRIARACDDA